MELIVDIQGFNGNNGELIPKEIAITSKNGDKIQHYILKPPFPWTRLNKARKKEAQWLLNHYHGLYWNSGHSEFEETVTSVKRVLASASQIYVKGFKKKKYLKNQLRLTVPIIDLVQYPSLKNANFIHFSCFDHSAPDLCALRNVCVIRNWLNILYSNNK